VSHTQKWKVACPKLQRVQEKAQANKQEQFTSLAHHLTVEALLRSYRRLKASSAPGMDGLTKAGYGKHLMSNLKELHARLRSGAYRASPALRHWIDKANGEKRPIGLLTTEDKIVQGAVVEILNCIYEEDFYGFSYGFRPGRSQHHALRALQSFLQKGQVNWVLDLDLKACFDRISHQALQDTIQHRVTDRSMARLIGKWLKVGVVEADGRREKGTVSTPQGAVISPLLANIVLHEAMDQVIHHWRQHEARGEVYAVRYADDCVLGFEYEEDAHALKAVLETSLADYGLSMNEAKTRLIRFGRSWPGKGEKSETFDFLGLTHIAGKDRQGRYLVIRKAMRKRIHRSLKFIVEWCSKHRHSPVRWQWVELNRKLIGHYNYYGVRGNFAALARFRGRIRQIWFNALMRRSQKSKKAKVHHLVDEIFVLAKPRITHSEGWLMLKPGYLAGRAGCGNAARPVL
jgi:group II intron reverse transcriptase/maturase